MITLPSTCIWTAQSIADYVAKTPAMDWATETDEDYARRFVRPVSEFGLSLRFDPVAWPEEKAYGDLMPVFEVEVAKIRSSTQPDGVCLDVIDHYIRRPDDLIDTDGWFNNRLPVLLLRSDGTYTIRDGHHRCIAALLRGDLFIAAHVVS